MRLLLVVLLGLILSPDGQAQHRWDIDPDEGIHWKPASELPHGDNIEMSGRRVSGIIHYQVDSARQLVVKRQVFFPQFHPYIKSNDPDWYIYRAYLDGQFDDTILPKIYLQGKQWQPGGLERVNINGYLEFIHHANLGLKLTRKLFPSHNKSSFWEELILENTSSVELNLQVAHYLNSSQELGAEGAFEIRVRTNGPQQITLKPGQEVKLSIVISGALASAPIIEQQINQELSDRNQFVQQLKSSLILKTPNPTINKLFEFSKIRAAESIFESRLGLIHSPGGGRYYVGIWANDQAEYAGPFFPYLGYPEGNEASLNAYMAFAGATSADYENIRYAFEIEGQVPPFDLDRGDAAMIAYGATQFALALGDKNIAQQNWPLITWCLEYCRRQLNDQGVVKSESDEMEGRIETGDANLATSALYYGALRSAGDLAKDLGRHRLSRTYIRQASKLAVSIEGYFGANVEGLDTYKYYQDHKHLRHWICLPLVVGLHDRKAETITALFDKLWTENGVHVEKNSSNPQISEIFWDRGTLYALRGTFLAGATDQSLQKLDAYSQRRLRGDHVPYAVEAYPEGNMAHLSAESALYCRVLVEGLFGIKPTGLKSFEMQPRLPSNWDHMQLSHVKAFDQNFTIEVERKSRGYLVRIKDSNSNRTLMQKSTSLNKPISFSFP